MVMAKRTTNRLMIIVGISIFLPELFIAYPPQQVKRRPVKRGIAYSWIRLFSGETRYSLFEAKTPPPTLCASNKLYLVLRCNPRYGAQIDMVSPNSGPTTLCDSSGLQLALMSAVLTACLTQTTNHLSQVAHPMRLEQAVSRPELQPRYMP